VAKRIFDLTVAVIVLLMMSPLMAALALRVKLDSPGPIFYRGTRVGYQGQLFRIFKYRTMVADAESIGGLSSAEGDVRVTRSGRFMRKHKLDELGQLFNVIKGDMSLVGPRPEVQHYVKMFTEEELEILSVRPGMTDWASLWNSDEGSILAGRSDPEKVYLEDIRPTKLKLQLLYVRNRSWWTDVVIIFKTIRTLVRSRAGGPSNLPEGVGH